MSILHDLNVQLVGEGPTTLVFAHGFGSDQTAWRHQVAAFKDRYRILLFDHLGCGQSNSQEYNPVTYNSLARYRDDLLAIYAALGLTQTIYVGHSMSAMMGALASIAYPEGFDRLIFVGASPHYCNDGAYIGGFTPADLDNLYRAMADNYLGWANGFSQLMMANADRPELGREFARTLAAMRPDIAQSIAQLIFESDLRAQIPLIRHPVLVLQAQYDAAVPVSVGAYLAATLPQAELVLLPTEGHLPHLSAPDVVTAAIRKFITR
jgi:sigma-B regulation protein RsbQ